jgi:uncharacterized MAPEG superfamily protein
MSSLNLFLYALAVVVLFLKFAVLAAIQGATRTRTKTFRHAEDAAHWGGTVPEREHPLVERAQRALLNDGESQPLFLALGIALVLLEPTSRLVAGYFVTYVVSRVLHTAFMLRGRQPYRNRSFAIGLIALFAMSVHLVLHIARAS